MDIVLVSPPEIMFKTGKPSLPPLGLAMLGAVLKEQGYSAAIIDAHAEGLSLQETVNVIRERYRPPVVGITGTTWNRFDSFETASAIKEASPRTRIVYGGVHATFTAEDTLRHVDAIDCIVRREGEETLIELMGAVSNGRDPGTIAGLSFREGAEIRHNPERPPIQDLDALPFPARHLLPMERYNRILFGTPATTLITSRGCPLHCMYCSSSFYWGKRYRYRSSQRVADEIETVMEQYGVKAIEFFDDTLTLQSRHVYALIDEIKKRNLRIQWYCEIRVDTVTFDLLKAMKDAGCVSVSFGAESGSQRILDVINKKTSVAQVERVVEWCKTLGIYQKVFFMFGLPEETYKDALQTVAMIKKMRSCVDDVAVAGGTSILPGTELERYAKDKGYLPGDFSWAAPYYDEDNPLIGRDPRLPTLIQPRMNNRMLRELNYEVEGRRYFKLKRLKKRLRRYHHLSEIRKDIRFLSSILAWGIKKGYDALLRKDNHRDAEEKQVLNTKH